MSSKSTTTEEREGTLLVYAYAGGWEVTRTEGGIRRRRATFQLREDADRFIASEEMLAVLKRVDNADAECDCRGPGDGPCLPCAVREAIAKATGGASAERGS